MTAPTVDPITRSARDAIAVLLELRGQIIVLTPATGVAIRATDGGRAFGPAVDRTPQTFNLRNTGAFDQLEHSPNDEGLNRKRAYTMTGAFDAVVAIGDTWSDDFADYKVETVDASSGYKTVCAVTAWVKVGNQHG